MTTQGIGVDIADVGRFERLFARGGEAFAAKWFTGDEILSCRSRGNIGTALAELFAAKEAVWKALAPGRWQAPLPWRSIGVHDGEVTLCEAAADAARGCTVRVSVARHGAIVVATAIVTAAPAPAITAD